jgi:hypothetical protein
MWLDSSKIRHCAPGIREWISSTIRGVASSWRPEMSNVGVEISCNRSVMSHVFSEPMQWNSLGPFIVWYTVGSSAIFANDRST